MICSKCCVDKPLKDFPIRKQKYGRIVYRTYCKRCQHLVNYPHMYKRYKYGVEILSDRYVLNKLNHSRNINRRHIFTSKDTQIIEIKRQLLILKRNIKKIENGR